MFMDVSYKHQLDQLTNVSYLGCILNYLFINSFFEKGVLSICSLQIVYSGINFVAFTLTELTNCHGCIVLCLSLLLKNSQL